MGGGQEEEEGEAVIIRKKFVPFKNTWFVHELKGNFSFYLRKFQLQIGILHCNWSPKENLQGPIIASNANKKPTENIYLSHPCENKPQNTLP